MNYYSATQFGLFLVPVGTKENSPPPVADTAVEYFAKWKLAAINGRELNAAFPDGQRFEIYRRFGSGWRANFDDLSEDSFE